MPEEVTIDLVSVVRGSLIRQFPLALLFDIKSVFTHERTRRTENNKTMLTNLLTQTYTHIIFHI